MLAQSRRNIEKGQLLIVRGTKALGLTPRGRIMRSIKQQRVGYTHPNKYYGITLEHISGPMKGVCIQFAVCEARKANIRPVCLCSAYDWPHRTGAGKCQKKT
jgi:hypothetical protein